MRVYNYIYTIIYSTQSKDEERRIEIGKKYVRSDYKLRVET